MVFISFLAIGAVSAADSNDIADSMELSAVDNEVQTVDADDNPNMGEVLSANGGNAKDIEIDITVENTTYDEQVFVNGTVVDNTGTIDFDNSTVEILVDDEYVTNAPISPSGDYEYALDLGAFEVGTHYAKATLINGDNKIVTAGTVFSIAKANPIVTLENITAIIGAGVKVPVNVTDRKGKKSLWRCNCNYLHRWKQYKQICKNYQWIC